MDERQSRSDEQAYRVEPEAWRVRDMPERLRPREAMERLALEDRIDEVWGRSVNDEV